MTNEERDSIARVFEEAIKRIQEPYRAEIRALREDIAVLRAREPARGRDGRDGVDGKSVTHLEVEQMIARQIRHGVNGKDGVSITADDVRPMIADEIKRQVAKLPKPLDGHNGADGKPGKDGRDGTSVSLAEINATIERSAKLYFDKLPIPQDGTNGKNGKDGTSVTVEEVTPMIDAAIKREVAKIPRPLDGKDGTNGVNGKDGASVALGDVLPEIEKAVTRMVAQIPRPQDGAPGRNGKDGVDGVSVTAAELAPMVEKVVAREVAKIPPPAAGRNGKDGASVSVADLTPVVEQTVMRAVAQIPVPKNGRDGKDGADGNSVDIAEVRKAVTIEVKSGLEGWSKEAIADVTRQLREHFDKKVSEIRVPKDGADGKDGESFTLADAKPIVERAVAQAVALIPLPQNGINGKDGLNGKDGRNGADGTSVAIADVMPQIEKLVTREVGRMPQPRDGRDGKDGDHGRDAAQIEILTHVVDGKSYARGCFASINGGLFQSNGIEWKCVVDGVAEVANEKIDERTFAIVHKMASGREIRQLLKVNAVIYHDVWSDNFNDGKGYDVGDAVTWDGSTFIARVMGAKTKPGESHEWRLSVKRGRNGAPAKG